MENQCRIMVLRIVLRTTLLYQTIDIRNINVLTVLKRYLHGSHAQKEQWGDFPCTVSV